MNQRISQMLCVVVFAAAVILHADGSVASKTIVVNLPSDLPEAAQAPSEAMYLKHLGSGEVSLYLEQDQGRKLTILDVTDPGKIRVVGQVPIDAPAPYDFVQNLGNSAVLIHYRNHSGFAVISFKNNKQPVLKAEPDYIHPASAQTDGPNTLLMVSSNGPSVESPTTQYEVVSIADPSNPTPIATIQGVIQRLDRPGTGTVFLLNDHGLTVIRYLPREKARLSELEDESN